ncbi:MAG: hypothetical protein H7231_06685 [Rhodoferax sp.]|nr:hypothetical protein [Actinomycetota bacterium]
MTSRTARFALGGLGVLAMLWAAFLTLTGGKATNPAGVATWLVAGLVLHDAVLAPVVVAVGWVCARVLPGWLRAPVQTGALVIGVLTLASVPLLLGRGHRPDNPSADPLDYPRNLLTVVAVVAVVCTGWAIAAWWRRSRSDAQGHEPAST